VAKDTSLFGKRAESLAEESLGPRLLASRLDWVIPKGGCS